MPQAKIKRIKPFAIKINVALDWRNARHYCDKLGIIIPRTRNREFEIKNCVGVWNNKFFHEPESFVQNKSIKFIESKRKFEKDAILLNYPNILSRHWSIDQIGEMFGYGKQFKRGPNVYRILNGLEMALGTGIKHSNKNKGIWKNQPQTKESAFKN